MTMRLLLHIKLGLAALGAVALLATAGAARADTAPPAFAAISAITPTAGLPSPGGPSSLPAAPAVQSPPIPARTSPVSAASGAPAAAVGAGAGPGSTAGPDTAGTDPAGAPEPTPPPSSPSAGDAQSIQPPAPSASTTAGGQGTPAAESNATTQTVWQLQASGCSEHCQGTSQTQIAQQQNLTVEAVATTAPAPTPTIMPPAPAVSPQTASSVTQIQWGCLAHCFGQTTTSSGPAASTLQNLEQLIPSLPLPTLPIFDPAPAAEQNVVQQSSLQRQQGGPQTLTQQQTATQTNATSQGFEGWAAQLQGALQESIGEAVGSVNQVAQGIWQLQIGCLSFCSQTEQSQQAEQTDTTIEVVSQTLGSTAAVPTPAFTETSEIIWQLQIGCLFWCYDAVEQQSASSQQTTTVVGLPVPTVPALPAPGETPSAPPGTDSTPAAPVLPVPPTAPNPAPGPGVPPPAPPAAGSPALLPTDSATGVTVAPGEPGLSAPTPPAAISPAVAPGGASGATRTRTRHLATAPRRPGYQMSSAPLQLPAAVLAAAAPPQLAGTPPRQATPASHAHMHYSHTVRTDRPSIHLPRARPSRPSPASPVSEAGPAGPDTPAAFLALLLVALLALIGLVYGELRRGQGRPLAPRLVRSRWRRLGGSATAHTISAPRSPAASAPGAAATPARSRPQHQAPTAPVQSPADVLPAAARPQTAGTRTTPPPTAPVRTARTARSTAQHTDSDAAALRLGILALIVVYLLRTSARRLRSR